MFSNIKKNYVAYLGREGSGSDSCPSCVLMSPGVDEGSTMASEAAEAVEAAEDAAETASLNVVCRVDGMLHVATWLKSEREGGRGGDACEKSGRRVVLHRMNVW